MTSKRARTVGKVSHNCRFASFCLCVQRSVFRGKVYRRMYPSRCLEAYLNHYNSFQVSFTNQRLPTTTTPLKKPQFRQASLNPFTAITIVELLQTTNSTVDLGNYHQLSFRLNCHSRDRHSPPRSHPPNFAMAISYFQPQLQSTSLAQQIVSRPINSQHQSPLYNKLPQEVRDIIFSYALLPYTPASPPPPKPVNRLYPVAEKPVKHNPWNPVKVPYPSNSTYSRPGQRAKVHHPTALLLVSRRTYLETSHLPVSQAAHNFYAPAQSGPSDVLDVDAYFNRMTAEQRALVRQVRVFANVSWLLDGGLESMASHEALVNIELLNLVIRWCDWRGWQSNERLSLRGTHPVVEEEEGEEEEEDEEDEDAQMPDLTLIPSNESPEQQEQEFFDHADAVAFTNEQPQITKHRDVKSAVQAAIAQLPRLKAVRLSIEAPYVKADELEGVIGDVQEWSLHLSGKAARGDDKVVKGSIERRFEWEAPMCAWSDFCAHCGGGGGDDKACEERKRRRKGGKGPRVQGAVVRWK